MEIDSETMANLLAGQGRVEGKLDILLTSYNEEKKNVNDRLTDVEKKVNIGRGILAVLMFVISPVLIVFGIYHRT